jgi:tRNA pseudouridine55 synthase
VDVTELELERFAPPDVGFRATVGGGTYVRSLARDLGEALGCGAHLATLTRTLVGRFRLADAVPPDALTAQSLRDPAELVRDLPNRELDDAGRAAVVHGRPVPAGDGTETGNVALFWRGQLVAVAERVGEVLKPRVVVVEQ